MKKKSQAEQAQQNYQSLMQSIERKQNEARIAQQAADRKADSAVRAEADAGINQKSLELAIQNSGAGELAARKARNAFDAKRAEYDALKRKLQELRSN
jgi:hypothetical protein